MIPSPQAAPRKQHEPCQRIALSFLLDRSRAVRRGELSGGGRANLRYSKSCSYHRAVTRITAPSKKSRCGVRLSVIYAPSAMLDLKTLSIPLLRESMQAN